MEILISTQKALYINKNHLLCCMENAINRDNQNISNILGFIEEI